MSTHVRSSMYIVGFQDIIEAKLVLIDVNDNPPRFKKDENDAYRVIIREVT